MEKYVIPNLRNACRLLKALAERNEPLSISNLAKKLHLPATSALRIVCTLELEGFVRRDRGEVRLGPALIYLGGTALKDTEIQREALPVLRTLAEAANETAHVAVPCDRRSLIVAVNDSPHPLRAASRPGTLTDLHCSSTGKVFLAYTFYEDLEEVLPALGLKKYTDKTFVSVNQLRKEIEIIRKLGYGVDDQEFHPGVRCLAAPVYGSSGLVIAAIGITAAATRFQAKDNVRIAKLVKAAADSLSKRLGCA